MTRQSALINLKVQATIVGVLVLTRTTKGTSTDTRHVKREKYHTGMSISLKCKQLGY